MLDKELEDEEDDVDTQGQQYIKALAKTVSEILTLYNIIHVLMRDEKEGRTKQARSNKRTTRQSPTTCICTVYSGHYFVVVLVASFQLLLNLRVTQ